MAVEEQFGPKEAEWDVPEEEKLHLDEALPARILEERLRAIAVTSVRTKNLFLFYLGLCVFALLTASTITDFQLLSGAAKIPLPIIKVEVRPLVLFYAGPFLVVGAYLYFLMYLGHLRRMIGELKATHPQTEEWRLYPWVFNMETWFARFVAFVAEYIMPAVVICALWYRSLVLHDLRLSAVLAALSLLSLAPFTRFLFRMAHFRLPARLAGITILGLLLLASGFVAWQMPLLMDESVALGRTGQPPGFFRGLLFRPADLALVTGQKAGFIDTYLVAANLTGANLPNTKFLGAVMKGARLLSANLERADFSRVPGKKPTDLSGADLTDANLKRASLREAVLAGATLRGADLSGADLRWANLEGAKLQEARLEGAQLQGANLRGADLRWSILDGAVLTGSDLREADLTRASLRGTDLRWADLGQAVLRWAILKDARFQESILLGTDFQGARFFKVESFQGALMDEETIQPDGTRGPIATLEASPEPLPAGPR